MKLMIADDHKVVRMGLSLIVKEEFFNAEIVEASNAEEVMHLLKEHKIDVVLLDIHMPETDSLMLLDMILTKDPNIKVLMVSLNAERTYALRYLKAGAMGYVQKSEDDDVIKKAIRKVSEGKKYLSDDVMDLMAEYLRKGNFENPFQELPAREFEVVSHLIKGLSSSEICKLMSLQPSTVSTYKKRIFEKLQVRTMHELIVLANQYEMFTDAR